MKSWNLFGSARYIKTTDLSALTVFNNNNTLSGTNIVSLILSPKISTEIIFVLMKWGVVDPKYFMMGVWKCAVVIPV